MKIHTSTTVALLLLSVVAMIQSKINSNTTQTLQHVNSSIGFINQTISNHWKIIERNERALIGIQQATLQLQKIEKGRLVQWSNAVGIITNDP